jgi:hypothetical protein
VAFEFIFGVAKYILSALSRTGQLVGNISFLAYEVKFEEAKPQKNAPWGASCKRKQQKFQNC